MEKDALIETEIKNYEQKFRRIIGYDVVMSFVWFQYFQMRLQYHASHLEEPTFLEALWQASTNPTILGIIFSILSVWIGISGLRIVQQGKELKRMRTGIAFLLTMWWGIFLVLEVVTLGIYALNLGSLSSGLDIVIDLLQTIFDPIINAFR